MFNLETKLTQKVRSEFIGRGKYEIVPDATGVDALLTGEVTAVTITPSSFNATQLASRYAITMTARVELRDMRENKVLWENPSLVFRQEYERRAASSALDPAAFFGQDTQRARPDEHRFRPDDRQRHPRSLLDVADHH